MATLRLYNRALEGRGPAVEPLLGALDLLLGEPSRKLVTYGTLAPGRSNHGLLAAAAGTWSGCRIRGTIRTAASLPYFTWDPDGPEVDAHLLVSEQLPQLWQMLDDFEGAGYQRRLVPVAAAGQCCVANIYMSAS